MNATELRTQILELINERLALEAGAQEQFRRTGRLDEVTAADSMLQVELVMMLEEQFSIRFEPDDIDTDLLCDLDRLTAFVAAARAGD